MISQIAEAAHAIKIDTIREAEDIFYLDIFKNTGMKCTKYVFFFYHLNSDQSFRLIVIDDRMTLVPINRE